ncbi:MAG: alanine dehydrogenase [Leptospiraceae bacterium]|nr:alanine dehydrogenase [Leptospiraceae bacterium]
MVIGVPKEIKKLEFRVAMTAEGVREAIAAGHNVLVEAGAGVGSGISDADYAAAGAGLMSRDEVFSGAEMIVKVKEPLAAEYGLFKPGQILFTYLHLAPDRAQTEALLRARVTAFAYETLEVNGELPLLTPMSEVAGRMAPLMGSFFLQKRFSGTGVLPAGATGTESARCVILGAGVVGASAARVAHGIGMRTIVLNRGAARLKQIDELYRGEVLTLSLTAGNIDHEIRTADMIIGALLVPGGRTPVMITRPMLQLMKPGAVIVDVSVDQGGCAETTVPRTHDDPVYTVDGVQHYTVANMPGAYPRTSTYALTNATLPWILQLANLGPDRAVAESEPLRKSLNLRNGGIMNEAVAAAMGA